jgi:hypothetical protein
MLELGNEVDDRQVAVRLRASVRNLRCWPTSSSRVLPHPLQQIVGPPFSPRSSRS